MTTRRWMAVCWFPVVCFAVCSAAGGALALVDLVTLPKRDAVQLTIYNAADLTLVRETRTLSLKKGDNRLEFSWANTLIDPTSIEFRSVQPGVELVDLSFPPRVQGAAIWRVSSGETGPCPVEISYFTSGLAWSAFYIGTLNRGETALDLEGYVRVGNGSGEDYQDAETRLVVGRIRLLDRIAELARRQAPYGDPRPGGRPLPAGAVPEIAMEEEVKLRTQARALMAADAVKAPKQIVKEGLSEYFLYSIEGTETIADGWAKRLPSFRSGGVPVENLFKYDTERYGPQVLRFLYFKNDESHQLGETPLPGGTVRIFQTIDAEAHLAYLGHDTVKYIPVGQEAELNLGPASGVAVEPKLMRLASRDFVFDQKGNVWGYTEVEEREVRIDNFRSAASTIEIRRHLKHPHWKIDLKSADSGYRKVDIDTIEFTVRMEPDSRRVLHYTLSYLEGKNRE